MKQILRTLQKGKNNRRKKQQKWSGLWNKLKSREKTVIHRDFSLNLMKEIFDDLFYGKQRETPRPIKVQIGISAKSEKAGNRKLRKKLKSMMNVETTTKI